MIGQPALSRNTAIAGAMCGLGSAALFGARPFADCSLHDPHRGESETRAQIQQPGDHPRIDSRQQELGKRGADPRIPD